MFIKELVPRRIIAWVARVAYNEPYVALPMRSVTPDVPIDVPRTLRYTWRRRTSSGREWESLQARAVGQASLPAIGSEALFITEHYWGYTRQRDGGTVEYEVQHPSWRVWEAETAELRADVARLYGPRFAEPLAAAPRSAFVAAGSPVSVLRPNRLT